MTKLKLRRGQKTLYQHQRGDILSKVLSDRYYVGNEIFELSRPYVLATLAKLYKNRSNNYGNLDNLQTNEFIGLLSLYKKNFVELKGEDGRHVSLTTEGIIFVEKLETALGGSLDILIRELETSK